MVPVRSWSSWRPVVYALGASVVALATAVSLGVVLDRTAVRKLDGLVRTARTGAQRLDTPGASAHDHAGVEPDLQPVPVTATDTVQDDVSATKGDLAHAISAVAVRPPGALAGLPAPSPDASWVPSVHARHLRGRAPPSA